MTVSGVRNSWEMPATKSHLEVGQFLGAASVGDEGGDACHHQQQDAGGDRQVAPSGLCHDGFERTGAMAHKHLPASGIASRAAASGPAATPPGTGGTAEDLVVWGVE